MGRPSLMIRLIDFYRLGQNSGSGTVFTAEKTEAMRRPLLSKTDSEGWRRAPWKHWGRKERKAALRVIESGDLDVRPLCLWRTGFQSAPTHPMMQSSSIIDGGLKYRTINRIAAGMGGDPVGPH